MLRFSEYVSPGHPDKVADYISEYLLDRYIEQDPNTRYAVEVQIKGRHVTLGGEVSSEAKFSKADIVRFVSEAVAEIGYTPEYAEAWGKGNAISSGDLQVTIHIGQQSPEIAQGLKGWGDQGIFFGMACPNEKTCFMPLDHTIAKRLCLDLYEHAEEIGIGIDIKTEIVIEGVDSVSKVIIAAPIKDMDREDEIMDNILKRVKMIADPADGAKIIINGTGAYMMHSTIADCGTTGRKLAVDFYGGNSPIGGGSPWTKDGSKADLTLNLYARELAVELCKKYGETVFVSVACCIGQDEVDVCARNSIGRILEQRSINLPPEELIARYDLNTPIFASLSKNGLFGESQRERAWEMI